MLYAFLFKIIFKSLGTWIIVTAFLTISRIFTNQKINRLIKTIIKRLMKIILTCSPIHNTTKIAPPQPTPTVKSCFYIT